MKPFAHTFFYLKEYDTRGGPGANFIVKWRAEKKINQPIVEALMLWHKSGGIFYFLRSDNFRTFGIIRIK